MMQVFQVGDIIPDFKVTDKEGHLKPLSEQMGEKGLLIFVMRGTWCPSCVLQIKTVQRYFQRYLEQGVNTQFILPEETDSVWTFKISQARPLQFGLHPDPQRETTELFLLREDVGVLPATYLLNTDRQVVWSYIGESLEDRPPHSQIMESIAQYLRANPA